MKIYVQSDPFPSSTVEVSAINVIEQTAQDFIKEIGLLNKDRVVQADRDFPIIWRKCFDLMKTEAVRGDHDALFSERQVPNNIEWSKELRTLLMDRLNAHGFKATRATTGNGVYITWEKSW